MSRPAWMVIELERDQWWVADTVSGVAYCVTSDTGERLWRSPGLQKRSLAEALKADPDAEPEAFADLECLGVTMRYLCEDRALAKRISIWYAGMVPDLRRSPDVLVKLGRDVDFDRLHRSIAGERRDVQVRTVDSHEWRPGSTDLPIIPAMQSPALTGRFCGLHAALLSTSKRGVLICGVRRSGKTSAALLAGRLGLASVLADEMVLIDASGKAYGLPLPVRERRNGDRVAWALPKADPAAHANAQSVRHVVVLEVTDTGPSWTEVISGTEQMQLLSPHARVLDGPLGRATASVLTLLRGTQVWSWRQRPWPSSIEDLEHGFRTILGLDQCQINV